MKVDAKQTVSQLVEPCINAEGFELADAVVSQYKSDVTVRLFVYGAKGVNLDQCAHLSRLVGDLIETAGLFNDGYRLEVSSPGLDRPLTTAMDFKYRVGESIRVEFIDKSRKKLRGEIVGISEAGVGLQVDDELITIDLAEISQAMIVI
jgi:ribosome maturation factor RimP